MALERGALQLDCFYGLYGGAAWVYERVQAERRCFEPNRTG
jgi:hypothetical protein